MASQGTCSGARAIAPPHHFEMLPPEFLGGHAVEGGCVSLVAFAGGASEENLVVARALCVGLQYGGRVAWEILKDHVAPGRSEDGSER